MSKTARHGVSVIIPTWNSVSTLEGAITSCLSQTIMPSEILVCDDGSDDASMPLVVSFGGIVKWLPGDRSGGPARPRNRGIESSSGEWLAFLDSDDEWAPTKLEEQLGFMQKRNVLACSTNAARRVNGRITGEDLVVWNKPVLTYKDLLRTNTIVCSSMMVHYSFVQKIGLFNEDPRLYEDYEYWLRVASWTSVGFIDKQLAIYSDMPDLSLRARKSASDQAHALTEKAYMHYLLVRLVSEPAKIQASGILLLLIGRRLFSPVKTLHKAVRRTVKHLLMVAGKKGKV